MARLTGLIIDGNRLNPVIFFERPRWSMRKTRMTAITRNFHIPTEKILTMTIATGFLPSTLGRYSMFFRILPPDIVGIRRVTFITGNTRETAF